MRTLLLPILIYASVAQAIGQGRETSAAKSGPNQIELNATGLAKALHEQISVPVPGIFFETGKATLRPESAAALAVIGNVLKRDATLKLDIQGHTDNAGDKASNLRLSQARVAAVREYLIKTFGVASDRLTATGFGDTQPVAANSAAQGRLPNARIELVRIATSKRPAVPASSGQGEWTGRITTGLMAIGGETTGIVLVTDRDQIELQPADQAMRQRLQGLNGQTVTIRGTLETMRGVEIRTRRIIKVTEIQN